MHVDNSACNLASLNLMRFRRRTASSTSTAFEHAVDVIFTAQEILVSNSSYPTEKIGENAHTMRQLGLGYANLGALLMARGLPYDSDEGRAYAAAITALMTGRGLPPVGRASPPRMGPFDEYEHNRSRCSRVIEKHRAAVANIEHRDTDRRRPRRRRARRLGRGARGSAASTATATRRPRCSRRRGRSAS